MSRIRGTNTRPELLVRRGLHAMGFRYKLNDRSLPGRPDLVMPKYASVIFVQGCYWHAHRCQKGRIPGSNSLFWKEKFDSNRQRDARSARKLRAMGWRVLHIWECELRTPLLRKTALEKLARKIRRGP
ncbi:very short patch repair endonuclease [Stenotrophomonas maltophilia]|nr:very short patch repair endonuclease [Stenotrophomonas maltophilia]